MPSAKYQEPLQVLGLTKLPALIEDRACICEKKVSSKLSDDLLPTYAAWHSTPTISTIPIPFIIPKPSIILMLFGEETIIPRNHVPIIFPGIL